MKRIIQVFLVFVLFIAVVFLLRKDYTISYDEAVSIYSVPESNFMEWRDIQLHYTDQGEGMPVMLLHGYAGSFDNWKELVKRFPEGYRLIVPDLPGLGLSQFPEDVAEDASLVDLYTDFTRHIIDELELDSVYIVGNSLGGYLAWETAVRNPEKVRKLVLLNAAGYSVEEISAFFIKFTQTALFKQVAKKGAPVFVARKAARGTLGDKSRLDPERVAAFHGMINKEGTLDVISRLGTSGQYPDSTRISQVDVPTLIVWGDKDGIIPVEHAYKFKRDIEPSTLLIYEGSGHVPMLENADSLVGDITHFFKGEILADAI